MMVLLLYDALGMSNEYGVDEIGFPNEMMRVA